jgi:hypothetical protein
VLVQSATDPRGEDKETLFDPYADSLVFSIISKPHKISNWLKKLAKCERAWTDRSAF